MKFSSFSKLLTHLSLLLRWDKPTGRLILLIPAGWSLWMTPSPPPPGGLVGLIIFGGLCVSGAGCIANDIWDRKIDKKVTRTKQRPLASGMIQLSTAWALLLVMLLLSCLVLFLLPSASFKICLALALTALPIIVIYPSAKRWFAYPQALLAICWGFAVLIPWAAVESSLSGGLPLLFCWLATLTWTFGFDTVYAMADYKDDEVLGLNSSVLSLGRHSKKIVAISYALATIFFASASYFAGVNWIFWPLWIISFLGMQREILSLNQTSNSLSSFSRHFRNQVWLGGLLLFGLILGRIS